MTNKDKVLKHIRKYGESIDQKLTPHAYITWYTTKGYQVLDCKTGKKTRSTINRDDNTVVLKANTTKPWTTYAKYYASEGILEIKYIQISASRVEGDPREWEMLGRYAYYICDNKELFQYDFFSQSFIEYAKYITEPSCVYNKTLYYRSFLVKSLIGRLSDYYTFHGNKCVIEEMRKYLITQNVAEIYVGNNKYYSVDDIGSNMSWLFGEYITRKINKPVISEKRKATQDELSKYLTKYDSFTDYDFKQAYKYHTEEQYTTYYNNKINTTYRFYSVGKFININDEIGILNIYHPISQYGICYNDACPKSYRLDDKIIIYKGSRYHYIRKNIDATEFALSAKPNSIKDLRPWIQILNKDQMFTHPSFKYYKSLVKTDENGFMTPFCINTILTSIKHPVIEQLCKMGCDRIATVLADDNQVKANILDNFGKSKNFKNLHNIFGLSNYQLQELNRRLEKMKKYDQSQILRGIGFIKELLTEKNYMNNFCDISYVDNDQFKSLCDLVCIKDSNIYRSYYWTKQTTELLYKTSISFYIPKDINIANKTKFLLKILKLCKGYTNGMQIYRDAINDYNALKDEYRDGLLTSLDCYSDITRLHDNVINLRNIQREEEQARYNAERAKKLEEFEKEAEKTRKKCRKYEYEDDTYCIMVPEKLADLVREGSFQRICIGGYAESFAKGRSNLFFLRKKSDKNTPFFAIEINPNFDRVIQIHGYGNKSMGADEDSIAAIPFIKRWIHRCGFECDSRIYLSTSCHYGMGNTFISNPAVDYSDYNAIWASHPELQDE